MAPETPSDGPKTRTRGRPRKTEASETPTTTTTPAETTAATTPATAPINSENDAESQKKSRGRPRKRPLEDTSPSTADSGPVASSTRAKRGRSAAAAAAATTTTPTTTSPAAEKEDVAEEPPTKKRRRPKKVDAAVAAALDRAKAEEGKAEKEKEKKEKEKAKQQSLKLKEKEKLKEQRDKEKEKEQRLKEKEKAKKQKEKEREVAKKLKEKERAKKQRELERADKARQQERDRILKAKAKEDLRKQKVEEWAADRAAKRKWTSPPLPPDGRSSGWIFSDVCPPGYGPSPQSKKSDKPKKITKRHVNTDDDVSDAAVERALTALMDKNKKQGKNKKTKRPNADDDEDDDEWATEDEAENLGMNLPLEIMIGQYKICCAEVETQWPSDAKKMKMAIMTHKTVDAAGVGLIASFNLGIVEGTMLLAGSVEAVQKIRNQISSDALIPIKRPNFDFDGERAEDYEPRHNRLFIRWRGRETGEGGVSTDNYYDKNNGYIDFITPEEGSQDKVKIKGIIDDVEGIEGPLTFEGERVKDSGGKKPLSWNSMGENDYYDGPGMMVF